MKLDKNLEEYLQARPEIGGLFLKVEITREKCFFGAEPVVVALEDDPPAGEVCERFEHGGVKIFVSAEYAQYFTDRGDPVLALRGRRRKKVVCENVKPIIKNLCRV
ncbi:MAG: hypothetical protein ACTSU5_18955 [Promethearchaeota archaeon]